MNLNDPRELDRIQAVCNAATAGPWKINTSKSGLQVRSGGDLIKGGFYRLICNISLNTIGRSEITDEAIRRKSDMEFICEARTAMPQLLRAVRQLQHQCRAHELALGGTIGGIKQIGVHGHLAEALESYLDVCKANPAIPASPQQEGE